jgi:hypothetical protein
MWLHRLALSLMQVVASAAMRAVVLKLSTYDWRKGPIRAALPLRRARAASVGAALLAASIPDRVRRFLSLRPRRRSDCGYRSSLLLLLVYAREDRGAGHVECHQSGEKSR